MMIIHSSQVTRIKSGIWFLGIPSFLFGTIDRGIAIFSADYISLVTLFQLLVINFLMISWIFLKPEDNQDYDVLGFPKAPLTNSNTGLDENSLVAAQARMLELQDYHMIRQEYLLPFPFICQIYHLLNLKHLETVHNFSLNNLKVVDVSSFYPTSTGGHLKFKTVLDSPFNILIS